MSEWKIKLIYFSGLWAWDTIACFKCILFVVVVCVCVCAWPCAHTCMYILLSLLLLSEPSTFVCFVHARPPACGCVSGRRCRECIHGHQVCVFLPSAIRQLRVDASYSWIWPLCGKRNKDASLDTPGLFNSHANRLARGGGGNTHHEW